MNESAILALAFVLSSVLIVSGTNICDNAQCESPINVNLGKEFTISLESNPSTGFEWWTKFDPNYLTLSNSTLIGGKKLFNFNTRSPGNTEVIMLLLRPYENGTISERKISPINIMSATASPKQATILDKSLGTTTSQITTTPHNPRSDYSKDESVMETPLQASSQVPRSYDVNLLADPKLLARFAPLRFT
jgi:predicted secreted protein